MSTTTDTTDTTITMEEFCRRASIRRHLFAAARIAENPNRLPPSYAGRETIARYRAMSHWICTFTRYDEGFARDAKLMTYFSQGAGYKGKRPDALVVLHCLRNEAQTAEQCPTFYDFCSEYGENPDSREAVRIHAQILNSARALRDWLGDHFYQILLNEVEPD